jgi:hypothetical protein
MFLPATAATADFAGVAGKLALFSDPWTENVAQLSIRVYLAATQVLCQSDARCGLASANPPQDFAKVSLKEFLR